ncbi:hypothetical protein J6590_039270 [Homalodisca vitripennis]|nr:hypothetical protein J6590_039270 [Homalodisca vitripennis]
MTWVIADHVAGGAAELSVTKGQQVEVVEVRPGDPGGEWCLVRMPTSGSAVDSPPEGLVPLAVLKQPPPGCLKSSGASATSTSPNRRTADHDLESAVRLDVAKQTLKDSILCIFVSSVSISSAKEAGGGHARDKCSSPAAYKCTHYPVVRTHTGDTQSSTEWLSGQSVPVFARISRLSPTLRCWSAADVRRDAISVAYASHNPNSELDNPNLDCLEVRPASYASHPIRHQLSRTDTLQLPGLCLHLGVYLSLGLSLSRTDLISVTAIIAQQVRRRIYINQPTCGCARAELSPAIIVVISVPFIC